MRWVALIYDRKRQFMIKAAYGMKGLVGPFILALHDDKSINFLLIPQVNAIRRILS